MFDFLNKQVKNQAKAIPEGMASAQNMKSDLNNDQIFFKESLVLISSDPTKEIIDGIETDIQFAEDMTAIIEVKRALAKTPVQVAGEMRFQFTQETYKEIHQKAVLHSQANTLNLNTFKKSHQIPQADKCPCGCKKAKGESFPFFTDEQKMNFLGPGIILFFHYIKSIIIILLVLSIVYAIFPLVLNLIGGQYVFVPKDCEGSYWFIQWFCYFKGSASIQNRKSNELTLAIQLLIGILVSIVWILALRVVRYYGRLKNKIVDIMLDSSSDYCIQINDLPYGDYHEEEVIKVLQDLYQNSDAKKKLNNEPLQIKSVQIIYNMTKFRDLMDKLNKKIMQISQYFEVQDYPVEPDFINAHQQPKTPKTGKSLRKLKTLNSNVSQQEWYVSYVIKPCTQDEESLNTEGVSQNAQQNPNETKYKKCKKEILELYDQLKQFRKQFISSSQFRQKVATRTCLVEFVDSEQQTKFINQFGRFRKSVLRELKEKIISKIFPEKASIVFKNEYLAITRAPEPSDINWQNCEKEFFYRRIFAVWGITLGIIGVSFGMLMLISFLRSKITALKNLSIFISISLQLFNRMIWKTLVHIVSWEENNTKTDAIISIMSKASFAQAVNVLVLPIIMNIYVKDNFSGPSGLIGLVLDFQFTIFLMAIAMNIVDPPYLLKKCILGFDFLRNRMIFHLSKILGQQYDHDEIRQVYTYYEQPDFPIAGAYVYMLTAINQAFFYCYLQPTLLFVIAVNMCLFMLIQKYLLVKRCKIPPLTDLIVFETCISLSMRIPVFFGIGSLYFVTQQSDTTWLHVFLSSLIIVISLNGTYNPGSIFTKCIRAFIGKEDDFQQIQAQRSENPSQDKKKKQVIQKFEIEPQQLEQNEGDISASNLKPQQEIKQNGKHVQVEQKSNKGIIRTEPLKTHSANKKPEEFYPLMMDKKLEGHVHSQRRECYYKNSNLNHLLNFQRDFMEVQGVDTNLSQKFCQKFQCNYFPPEQINKCTALLMIQQAAESAQQEHNNLLKIKRQKLKNASKLRKHIRIQNSSKNIPMK